MYENTHEAPFRDLLSRLSGEFSRLVRADLALMRTELKARISWLKTDLILMVAGIFMAMLGVLAMVATIIIAISYAVPLWLSALIVTLFLLIAGGSIAIIGLKRLKQTDWAPRQTARAIKEEGAWLREKLA